MNTRSMTNPWLAVERWWFSPLPAYPLAFCRIALGLILVANYVLMIPNFEILFAKQGLLDFSGNHWHTFGNLHYIMFVGGMISSMCFALGYKTCVSGIIAVVCHHYYVLVAIYHWGWYFHIHIFMIYVMLGNSAESYSLDALIKRNKGLIQDATKPFVTPAYPIRLTQIHICTIYLAASWHRYYSDGWIDGIMVFEALSASIFTRFPTVDWYSYRYFLTVLQYLSWFLELTAPVFLWLSNYRWLVLIGLCFMHVSLELTTTVGFWQFTMLSVLTVFMPIKISKSILDWLWNFKYLFRFRRFRD